MISFFKEIQILVFFNSTIAKKNSGICDRPERGLSGPVGSDM